MEILPCPFCGYKPEECYGHTYTGVSSYKGDRYYVQCDFAGCNINPTTEEFGTAKAAIRAWNKRVG